MHNSKLELRRLSYSDEAAFKKAVAEWDSSPEFLFVTSYDAQMKFSEYVDLLKDQEIGKRLPEGYVPATSLFGFYENNIVGRVSIRHRLNDFLFKVGGHIGYGVLPRFRRQGFAKAMLKDSLPITKNLGLTKVLVTCDDDNIGSIKTIEANGGVLENKITIEPTKPMKRRYWIDISGR